MELLEKIEKGIAIHGAVTVFSHPDDKGVLNAGPAVQARIEQLVQLGKLSFLANQYLNRGSVVVMGTPALHGFGMVDLP